MEPVDTEIPLVIIINDKSASASEIVAKAGSGPCCYSSRSFGKGLVQNR
jgi:carboxyl-terminal processing protease